MPIAQKLDLSVLFLSGEENRADGSRVYRCDYQAQQLRQSGAQAAVAYVGDCTAGQLQRADVVVFSRCLWRPEAVRVVRTARQLGKVLCGDLDDRIFCPWQVEEIGFLRSKQATRRYGDALGRVLATQHDVLRLLPAFDQVLVSTPCLAEDIEALGMSAHVAANAIDTGHRRPVVRARQQLKRMLFMTGTRTHDADLREIVPGVARFLREYPGVELTLLGPLEVPPPLAALPNVRAVAKLPLAALDGFVAEHDLCLAPLEPTRFNDCKSAIKFVECGLVSVPIVASPRREFVRVIRHGETGWLADTPSDWYQVLQMVARSGEALGRVARSAHEVVLAEHTVQSRGPQLAQHLQQLVDIESTPALVPGQRGSEQT